MELTNQGKSGGVSRVGLRTQSRSRSGSEASEDNRDEETVISRGGRRDSLGSVGDNASTPQREERETMGIAVMECRSPVLHAT